MRPQSISLKRYSLPTNFRLEFIEPSAREVFIFWTMFERENGGGANEERRREHGSNPARPETASKVKN